MVAAQFFMLDYDPNIWKYLVSAGFHYYTQYMQKPSCLTFSQPFLQFYIKTAKTAPKWADLSTTPSVFDTDHTLAAK